MPFGMGPAGWFMWPYFAQWPYYGNPWYGYNPYYSYPYPGYGGGYPGYGFPPYAPPMTREQETAMLQEQAKSLEDELAQIRSRIEELEKPKSTTPA